MTDIKYPFYAVLIFMACVAVADYVLLPLYRKWKLKKNYEAMKRPKIVLQEDLERLENDVQNAQDSVIMMRRRHKEELAAAHAVLEQCQSLFNDAKRRRQNEMIEAEAKRIYSKSKQNEP